jgi:hypothetical protein
MNRYAISAALGTDRKRKKEVRDFLFSLFMDMHLRKIVGLAGPNIQDYINFCKSKGFTEFEIYEKDGLVAMHQLIHLQDRVQLNLKDILHANADEPDTFYDLDYCGTVRYLKEHIAKFKNRFIMTFSCRVSKQETIDTFFGVRGETIKKVSDNEYPIKHTEYITNAGKYIFALYKDTTPMCCFAKIA